MLKKFCFVLSLCFNVFLYCTLHFLVQRRVTKKIVFLGGGHSKRLIFFPLFLMGKIDLTCEQIGLWDLSGNALNSYVKALLYAYIYMHTYVCYSTFQNERPVIILQYYDAKHFKIN